MTVIFVYLIARKLDDSKNYALIVVVIYAFFFPLIYFNSFILSEHLSIFVLLLSIVLLFYANIQSTSSIVLVGLTLGFSVALRPSLGLVGLAFFIFIYFSNKSTVWKNIQKVLLFSLAFFSLVFFVSIENYKNSNGNVKTLSANGGLTFYFSQCNAHKVSYQHPQGGWYQIIPPRTAWQPELETLRAKKNFYEQSYFYEKGLNCIQDNPNIWIQNFQRLKHLYFDSMFPGNNKSKFYEVLSPLFSNIAFVLTCLLLLLPLMYFDKYIHKSKLYLLLGVAFSQLLVLYFFNVEQRYLYGFFFVVVLISISIIFNIKRNFHKIKWWLFTLLFIYLGSFIYYFWQKEVPRQIIEMQVFQEKSYIRNITQKRTATKSLKEMIPTIDFKTTFALEHNDLGEYPFKENIFIDFFVDFELTEAKHIQFIVASDDGFILYVDDVEKMSYKRGRAVAVNKKYISLKPKKYSLKISYYQGNGPMALRVYYEIDEKRYLAGEDSPYLKFKQK